MNRFIAALLDEAIGRFEETRWKADLLLAALFRQRHIGKRDRTILRELFFTYLRRRYLVESFMRAGLTRPDAVERARETTGVSGDLLHSFPPLYRDAATARYGDGADAALAWLNGRAPTTIRANVRRFGRDELRKHLAAEGIRCVPTPTAPHGLIVTDGASQLTRSPLYEKGFFELQDESSQLAVGLVPEGAATLLDLCAGGGGKSLAIAAQRPDIKITASDIRTHRFDEITERATRAGTPVTVVAPEKPGDTRFDTVLVDAPCSGSGVLRRNPEDRWRVGEKELAALLESQRTCLDTALRHLAPGGAILYLTCSYLPVENEENIAKFTAAHHDVTADGPGMLTAPGGTADLMFATLLRRR
ncbi:MAG TPA: RsmB/NOP family class I SAM-dependent RNA methyltransferase [bacterium]|nr:RsmB/NOP family class I SAM-dependent RNA methyltransferase [bacterium]